MSMATSLFHRDSFTWHSTIMVAIATIGATSVLTAVSYDRITICKPNLKNRFLIVLLTGVCWVTGILFVFSSFALPFLYALLAFIVWFVFFLMGMFYQQE